MFAIALLFEDENEALEFINETQKREKVKGVYKYPTLYCEGSCGRWGFTQGRRWGWWVCAVCKKPRWTAWENYWDMLGSLGYNQMERLVQEGKIVAFTESTDV
jgi:hypothetical protein